MDTIVKQMKVETEMYEKAQEEQKVTRERWMTAAAICIQTHFRGYKYENLNYCYRQLTYTVVCFPVSFTAKVPLLFY